LFGDTGHKSALFFINLALERPRAATKSAHIQIFAQVSDIFTHLEDKPAVAAPARVG
jgi:hypothetical protein